ncbi:MAG: hypothetical protein ACK4F8_01755 [Aquabacterium sp.]
MRSITVLAFATLLSSSVLAQSVQSGQDHAAHHPAGASAVAPKSATKPAAKSSAQAESANAAPSAMQMDAKMKSMQEMHDKMMAAKTLEERQALMSEHMKSMREGMGMMGQMKGGKASQGMRGKDGMPCHDQMMAKRMEMMEMMMQMMMDREAVRSLPAK